jgi:DNA-binding transcriptional MerR regulator
MSHSISDAAAFAGVSTRVLRHYDEIGLLQPSARTNAGYRQYSDDDLLQLQRIVGYRELGLGLDDIRRLLTAAPTEAIEALEQQEAVLTAAVDRLTNQLTFVTKTRKAKKMGVNLTPNELQDVFGDHDPTQYQEEAEQRWGNTDAYKESHRRTSSYTKDDWARQAAESEAIELEFLAAMQQGLYAESPEAKAAAERHRLQIDTWFYPCSYEIQTGLAEMYVMDERFTAHYDKRAVGLAVYVRDAIIANALDHL